MEDSAARKLSTLDRIKHYIKNPPENSRVFTLTPDDCEELLRLYNSSNRPKKPRNIIRYSEDMGAEPTQWMLTGDTLKFSDKGILRDGQNRLMSSVRCGKPFTTHIVFGIPDAAFDVLDRGKPRSGGDVLHNAGYANSNKLATAVSWKDRLDGNPKSRDTMEPKEALELVRTKYRELPGFINIAQGIYRTTGTPVGMAAACLYTMSQIDPQAAASFGTAWESGQHHGRFSPLAKMHKKIAEIAQASSGRVHDTVRAAFIVIAWNLYRSRKTGRMSDFNWTPAEDFPVFHA